MQHLGCLYIRHPAAHVNPSFFMTPSSAHVSPSAGGDLDPMAEGSGRSRPIFVSAILHLINRSASTAVLSWSNSQSPFKTYLKTPATGWHACLQRASGHCIVPLCLVPSATLDHHLLDLSIVCLTAHLCFINCLIILSFSLSSKLNTH